MVSDVTIGTAVNQQQSTNNATTQLASDFSQFLTLLTVQLQNQDPLSPMDTTEFTNQLVAFSGVEQQINTNQKLDSLVALNLGSSFSSALGYVGKDVSYVSSEFYNDGENPSTINYALNKNAFDAKIRILNEEGDIIYEADAETSAGGSKEFIWDGKDTQGNQVEPGTYEVKIDALDFDGNTVGSSVVVNGTVRGIETQNGAIFLLVGDRAVSVGNVLNVSQPNVTPSSTNTDNTTTTPTA
jgi:flagellar basal-body rod modification protein FlgD